MDAVKLPEAKLDMLRLLLKDPKIRTCVIVDGAYAGEIVVKENGDVLLGKSKYGWVNRLFGSYKEIDFFTIASKIAVVITGGIAKSNSKDMVGMLEEIANKTLIADNREQIIDLLFQWVVLFDQESIYASKYIQGTPYKMPDQITIGHAGIDIGGAIINIPVTLDKRQYLVGINYLYTIK